MCTGWLVCSGKKGGQRVGRTCGGSTSKRHAVVDGNGLPLAVVLSDGRCHDSTRAIAAVESIQIGCLSRRPRGLVRTRIRLSGLSAGSICPCVAYGTVFRKGRRQRENGDGLRLFIESCLRIVGRWSVSLPGWTTFAVWQLDLNDSA